MSATDIWDILRDSMYNREEGNAFITSVKLRKIWSGDRLERFSRDCQLGLDQAQIKTTKAELLHIISCLVGIAWPDWSRFRSIFFPPEGHLQDRRRDCNALDFTRDELEHESFLGKGPWADLFDRVRWTYFPVVLTPYTHETYHHHRLPLIPVDSEPPRQGGYGEITKEKIPAGQIITGTLPVDLSAPRPVS